MAAEKKERKRRSRVSGLSNRERMEGVKKRPKEKSMLREKQRFQSTTIKIIRVHSTRIERKREKERVRNMDAFSRRRGN